MRPRFCSMNKKNTFAKTNNQQTIMKRHVMAVAVVMACIATAQAQTEYRPAGGEKNLELMFAPLGGSPVSMAGIKFRKFNSATSALRLGVFVGFQNKTTILQNENTQAGLAEEKKKEGNFTIAIQPGIEKHLKGTERLSPYFGGYLDLSYAAKSKKEDLQDVGSTKVGYTKTNGGDLGLGLNAVAGFDYYFAKSLYLGSELGFGVAAKMPMKDKTETLSFDNGNEVTTNSDSKGKESSIQLGPNVVGQLRLGWLF